MPNSVVTRPSLDTPLKSLGDGLRCLFSERDRENSLEGERERGEC